MQGKGKGKHEYVHTFLVVCKVICGGCHGGSRPVRKMVRGGPKWHHVRRLALLPLARALAV